MISKQKITQIKETSIRLFPYIIMAVLATVIYFKMNVNNKLSIEVEAQKLQAKVYEKNAKGYIAESDVLKKQIPELKNNVKDLEQKSKLKDNEISSLKNKVNAKLSDIKTYNSNDIAKYYQNRYKDKKGVVLTQYGVALNDTVAKNSISELTICDGTTQELSITKEKLETTNKIVIVKDGIIANVESQNNSLNLAIVENNKALDANNEIIKKTEKGLRHERNKKNFWKLATGTVLTLSGYLLFTK